MTALFFAQVVLAQPVDWWTDAPLFATGDPESSPSLTGPIDGNHLRAFCLTGGGTLFMRRSSNMGAGWGAISALTLDSPPVFAAASDASRSYFLLGSSGDNERRVYLFDMSDDSWAMSEDRLLPATTDLPSEAVVAFTDVLFESQESYLSLAWIEYDAQASRSYVRFAQSRDQGASFLGAFTVGEGRWSENARGSLAMTATWQGDEESLLVAATLDRLGSTGPQLRVFRSVNQGADWIEHAVIDASGEWQDEVSMCAYGQTVALCYTSRETADGARRLYFTYSPDGGETFAPVDTLTTLRGNIRSPRLTADPDGARFHLTYLAGDVSSDTGAVFAALGQWITPWAMESPVQVSGTNSTLVNGKLAVTSKHPGVAVAWTNLWFTGDSDIRFDASWRTQAGETRTAVAQEYFVSDAFPNPFNAMTSIRIHVARSVVPEIRVYDLTGRELFLMRVPVDGTGERVISIDMRGYSSGSYFARTNFAGKTIPLMLLK